MDGESQLPTGERALSQGADTLQMAFLTIAAHELQSPFASIYGYAQLILQLAEQERVGERIVHAAEAILQQAVRGRRLVEGLLDVGRSGDGELRLRRRRTSLGDLVQRVVADQQLLGERHRLRVEVAAEPLFAEVDVDLLEQALANLVNNACKYSPDGGEVLIQLEQVAPDVDEQLPVDTAAATGWAALSVVDSGLGIAPDEHARVFERFYRSRDVAVRAASGLGLGLYLCRAIALGHGGAITVHSALRRGSTFTIYLPLSE